MLCVAAIVAGCQSDPPRVADPLPVAGAEYDRFYEATRAVLRDRGFELAQQNYRFGLVTTEPLTARTLFEPIGDNHQSLASATRSTLRHTRRKVRVALEPQQESQGSSQNAMPAATQPITLTDAPPTVATTKPAEAAYQLRVVVTVEARQAPTRRVIGGTGRRVFSTLNRVPKRWARRGIEKTYWHPLGRDRELEAQLRREIVRGSFDPRFISGQGNASPPQPR
jgi:hypothetical protein